MTPSPTRQNTFKFKSSARPQFPHNLSGAEFRALAERLIEDREGSAVSAFAALVRLASKKK